MTNGYNTPIGVPIGLPSILSLGLPPLINPYPTLNLDFIENSQLDPRITFTRASTATYFNSLGVLTTANNDVARFDYNPSTLQPRGLLIEEQRTNSWSRSEEFDDASWIKGGATVTANSTTAPSGTTTADTLVEDTSTGQHRVFRAASGTTNANPYTVSFFAKASARTRVYVGIAESPTFVRQGNAVFDLSAGTVVSASSGAGGATGGSATIQNVGNGWYRCAYTLTLGGTDTAIFSDINLVSTGTTINYTGNGTGSVFLWGAQLEAGAFATSYIPTTTTALTRNADVASMTGTNFSSWYNASEGTFVAQVIYNADAACKVVFINDGTYNNIFSLQREASLDRWQTDIFSATSRQALLNFATNSASVGFVSKCASVYKVNDFAGSANGGAVITDTSGLVQASVDRLALGRDNVGSAEFLNGYIQRISFWPVRLANSQLQALTS